MVDFEQALKIAANHFARKGASEADKIYDAGNSWIVFTEKEDLPRYGNAGISIDKASGAVSSFILPSRRHFEVLKKAKLVPHPWPGNGAGQPV